MALDCDILGGRALQCLTVGGVDGTGVYIGVFSGDTTYAVDSDNVITGVTSANEVFLFEQDIEQAGFTQEGTTDRNAGTNVKEITLTIKLLDIDKELRNRVLELSRAPIYAVIKSNTGKFLLLGKTSSGRASTDSSTLGVTLNDQNGSEISFVFRSQFGYSLIDGSLIGTDIPLG